MKKYATRFLALALAACMIFPPMQAAGSGATDGKDAANDSTVMIPEPYYEFTFDKDRGTDGRTIENEGSKKGVTAKLEGSKNPDIVYDNARAGYVLDLPGGTSEGSCEGRLTLPENMFADVTDQGFAFSFWIQIDSKAAQYARIFSASVYGQNTGSKGNANDYAGWPWIGPEFSFVAGLENAEDLADGKYGYHTAVVLPGMSTGDYEGKLSSHEMKLVWNQQFAKGRWQHVTISVTPKKYDVYLDGGLVGIKYDRRNNMETFLGRLFANNAEVLKQYRYCGIGPSIYRDPDLKAKVDEFRFYNQALTEDEAKAAYESYRVDQALLDGLQKEIDAARKKSISFYTRDSFQALLKAIQAGEEGMKNPVTGQNVKNLTKSLTDASDALVFYEGVDQATEFSNNKLKAELAEANGLLSDGNLSAESDAALKAAAAKAKEAASEGAAKDQAAVDQALSELEKALDAKTYAAALRFDADPAKSRGALFHGSTGFLYGTSEVNVPSADLIQAIAPKIMVQKAADGKQHPSGDVCRLTPFLKSCGVENIQVYLQDFYLEWPYESNGIDDYNQKVDAIVKKMTDGKTDEEIAGYSFVIFNEPDGIWYQNKMNQMCTDWLKIYRTIKNINPKIKVAGPNFAVYNSSAYRTFFEFCKKNSCLPEYVTWHELQKDKLRSFQSHCDEVKGYLPGYYADSGIDPVIFVNEVANFSDVGNPGGLVNWLSIFEEEDIYASLPYWGLANSLNELAADANKPNGAWWVYKWYAQMTGNKMPLQLENIKDPGPYGSLYGLASVDDHAGILYSLFGGQAGKQTISIQNIRSTKTFQNAGNAYVKIYRTKYTGHQGFADETPAVFEGNLAFAGNDLVFTIPSAELTDAYFAVIMPAAGKDSITLASYGGANWEMTYEAEDAKLLGEAVSYKQEGDSTLARSNRSDIGHMNTENDGVEFTVNVPKTGRYRLNIYYSSQAPQVDPLTLQYVASGGQNRAIGALMKHSLSIDGGAARELLYDSTVKWGYYNCKTEYIELTEGEHKITLMYQGENQNTKDVKSMLCATLDKIDLVYAKDQAASITVEPEELAGSKAGYAVSKEGAFSGAGAASGSGPFDFYVSAPRDGYYKVSTKGNGNAALSKSKVNYAKDAKAESSVSISWLKLFDLALGSDNAGMVYLAAGMNHLLLEGNRLTLDKIVLTEVLDGAAGSPIIAEAEDCRLEGTDPQDGYTYLRGSKAVPEVIETPYASGKKAVEGFRGGFGNKLTLAVNVPAAGNYKLSIAYSNNEPAPVMKTQGGKDYVHPYNTDLVERYMQIMVNKEQPQTVYFRNTLCWDAYRNAVIDIALAEGENILTFTNDNSYKFSPVQDDFSPRLDKFIIVPAAVKADTEADKNNNPITGIASELKKAYGDRPFTIKASAQGKITYKSSDEKVIKVGKSTGKATITGCGKALITVSAAGNDNYKPSSVKIPVTIAPRKQIITSLKSKTRKTLAAEWKKDPKASGFQIQYTTDKKFKKSVRTIHVKKNTTTGITIPKLNGGKRYYVRVRAYKISGKSIVYGSFSKLSSANVKK